MTDQTTVQYRALERQLEPKGRLLNDNIIGVDHLGYSIYAEALSELLHRVHTPLTVGVFAPWGSGKSFLLREVRYLLSKFQKQDHVDDSIKDDSNRGGIKSKCRSIIKTIKKRRRKCSCIAWSVVMLLMIVLLVGTLVIALHPTAQQAVYEILTFSNDTSTFLPQTREFSNGEPTAASPQMAAGAIGFFAVTFLLSAIGLVFLVFVCCATSTD
uniref:KAP NTPase domain-containing protein n=1 Tax=Ciona savignyi TaxID=51511 RepID=H2YLT1_CIOSA